MLFINENKTKIFVIKILNLNKKFSLVPTNNQTEFRSLFYNNFRSEGLNLLHLILQKENFFIEINFKNFRKKINS